MIIITDVELFNQLKRGDRETFVKWMGNHTKKIEKFVVQYGCSSNQIQQVTEATFRKLYIQLTELEDENQLHLTMYKIALKLIRNVELTTDKENILPFEEDQHLHEKIMNLGDEHKVTLLLSYFHGMTEIEIQFISDIPVNNVLSLIDESRQKLNRNQQQIEKQLQFLAKSYDRLRFSFTYENIYSEVKVESEPIQKPKSKKVEISWIAGVITLLTLITVSVVTGEEYQKSSTEKYVERLKVSFEKEVKNKFNELGFPETIEQDGYEFISGFADAPRSDFDAMIRRIERQLRKNEEIDKKEIKKEYKEILEQLQLPSEMAEQLIKNPLTNDKRKSGEFINSYLEKLSYIQDSFYTIYYNHQEIIDNAMVNETIDIEKFMEKMDTYPEDFQKILTGVEKQNYYPISIPNMAAFYPQYQSNELSKKIRKSLHEDVSVYITMLETKPFMNYQGLTNSLDESVDFLIDMEKTLLATDQFIMHHGVPNGMLVHTYSTLFNVLVIDDEMNEIFDEEGVVKEEFHAVWERIANIGGDSPAAFIMENVIEEMKASGWKESKSYNRLDHNHIYNALSYAQENRLDSFTFDELMGFGTITTSIQDPEFQLAVSELYANFYFDHNLAVLQDANPLLIIGLYYYANELEDPETMWQLFDHESVPVSLEDYVDDWMKKDSLLEQVESIFVDMGGGSGYGTQLVPVGYEQDGTINHNFVLMRFDSENNIWTIHVMEDR